MLAKAIESHVLLRQWYNDYRTFRNLSALGRRWGIRASRCLRLSCTDLESTLTAT